MRLKLIVLWVVMLSFLTACISLQFYAGTVIALQILRTLGGVISILVLLLLPVWISGSSYLVSKAVSQSRRGNYEAVNRLLNGWFPIYPALKYAEYIVLLRQNACNPREQISPLLVEEDGYFVRNDFGGYVLSEQGEKRMLSVINRGLFTGGFFRSKRFWRVLQWLLIAAVVLKVVSVLFGILFRGHSQ